MTIECIGEALNKRYSVSQGQNEVTHKPESPMGMYGCLSASILKAYTSFHFATKVCKDAFLGGVHGMRTTTTTTIVRSY